MPAIIVVVWVGSSLQDLREFPEGVRATVGYSLYLAQLGEKHLRAKPLRGFSGAGVLEMADDFDGSTYRAVYSVQFSGRVYVLHAFQKKSTRGIETPKRDMDLVRRRLRVAEALHARQDREEDRTLGDRND